MSFGFSISDITSFVQLTWQVVEGARKACGEHDDLTKEILSLYTVLAHVRSEMNHPESVISKSGDHRLLELRSHIQGCERHLKRLDLVLSKYNALSSSERSVKKLWQKVQFGNNEIVNVKDIRQKILTYTTAISTTLQLLALGSQGRVEKKLTRQGGKLEGIQQTINLVLAKISTSASEGSVMTDYRDDDKAFWRSFRRQLVKEGYSSSVLKGHERLITDYVKELGERGVLDDGISSAPPKMLLDVAHSEATPGEGEPGETNETVASQNEEEPPTKIDSEVTLSNAEINDFVATKNEEAPSPETDPEAEQGEDEGDDSRPSVPSVPAEDTTNERKLSSQNGPKHDEAARNMGRGRESRESSAPDDAALNASKINVRNTLPKSKPLISVTKQKVPAVLLPRPIVEDALDEDFTPGAHPNVASIDEPLWPKPPPSDPNSMDTDADASKIPSASTSSDPVWTKNKDPSSSAQTSTNEESQVSDPSLLSNPELSPAVQKEPQTQTSTPSTQAWIFYPRPHLFSPRLFPPSLHTSTTPFQTRYDEFIERYNTTFPSDTLLNLLPFITQAPSQHSSIYQLEFSFLQKIWNEFKLPGLQDLARSVKFEEEFYRDVCGIEIGGRERKVPEDIDFVENGISKHLFSYRWDAEKEPIALNGNVFDAVSLGEFFYYWASFLHGLDSPESKESKILREELCEFEKAFSGLKYDLLEIYSSETGVPSIRPMLMHVGNKIWVKLKECVFALEVEVNTKAGYGEGEEERYARAWNKLLGERKWVDVRSDMKRFVYWKGFPMDEVGFKLCAWKQFSVDLGGFE